MKILQNAPELSQIKPVPEILLDTYSMELARKYNEKYLHWNKLQYYDCGQYGRESLWYIMKTMRMNTCKKVNIGSLSLNYNLLERFHKPLHQIDMALSLGLLPIDGFDGKRKAMLSVGSMMEESIASSQIEGAATAIKDAKKMLRNTMDPKNKSEKMILNNYNAMEFIRTNLDRELSPEFIRELHSIVTCDTLEKSEYEGNFRKDNSVAVRDVITGEACHKPVSCELIDSMTEGLYEFVNDEDDYIHPVIKGILIHFITAYIHPFMDGNGRVSRSLFYWYTMKKGYSVMEYLSISKAIKEHKSDYEEAYRLSETDGNDVTYFIDYNIRMLMQSVEIFSDYLREKINERRNIRNLTDECSITQRQSDILASLMNSDTPQSVYELASKIGMSPQTVRNDLYLLIDKGYAKESPKEGHKQMFVYSGKRSGLRN